MTTTPIRVPSDDEVAYFREHGVVCLRKAISAETVSDLADSIECLSAQIDRSDAGYDLENLGDVAFSDTERIEYGHAKQYDLELFAGWLRYEGNPRDIELLPDDAPKGAFLLDTGCWRRDKNLAKLATSRSMGKLAARLLSANNIAFFDDQMFVKRPGTKQKTTWHQDFPFFHITGSQGLVAWIAVDPVSEENGAMRYVRGSHKWTEEFGASMFVSRTLMPGAPGNLVPDIDAAPDEYDIVSFETEPGDIICHHFKTVHGAGGNKSTNQMRRAMSLRYVGDEVRYRLKGGAPFPPHLTCQLNEGEPVYCDDYPLIYNEAKPQKAAIVPTSYCFV